MLQTLLARGRPLLADGATGTNLFEVGLTSGDNPELWNGTHADEVEIRAQGGEIRFTRLSGQHFADSVQMRQTGHGSTFPFISRSLPSVFGLE